MKITDLRCVVIGGSPVVRIVTDSGISGCCGVSWWSIQFPAIQAGKMVRPHLPVDGNG